MGEVLVEIDISLLTWSVLSHFEPEWSTMEISISLPKSK